jgi:hypothetical protein
MENGIIGLKSSALRCLNEKTEEEMTLDMMFHLKKGDTELSIAP